MRSNKYESGIDFYEQSRIDTYDYQFFSPEENPEDELLIKRIQAQSYVNMRIVRPEGLMTLANGSEVLSPEALSPSGVHYAIPDDSLTECALGIKKGTTDFSPITGSLVAWKKLYTHLDALPAYQFNKCNLWLEGEQYLRYVEASSDLVLVEPEALGKTVNAGGGAVKELIRAEIQRALGKGEVWFMGLVEGTAFESFMHNWGQTAVRQIGAPKRVIHPWMYENVALVPTVMDIDNFYSNMKYDILTPGNKSVERQIVNFVYMTDGVSDIKLGPELAEFRDWCRDTAKGFGGDV